MSKKYMDFVPVKNADNRAAVLSGAPRRTNVAQSAVVSVRTTTVKRGLTRAQLPAKPKVMMPEPTATPRSKTILRSASKQPVAQRATAQRQMYVGSNKTVDNRGGFAIRDDVKLGEIEDLSPKFVKVDVPKRPLGDNRHNVQQPVVSNETKEAKEAKPKKLMGRFRSKKAAKNTTKAAAKAPVSSEMVAMQKKDTFVAPKPAFINQDKVAKRPLSKNVYEKKVVTTTNKKKSDTPVAIIEKPEKESKIGLVVTIILTIILGAVAGTVAFLLLPK